jgi:hypothetical protein
MDQSNHPANGFQPAQRQGCKGVCNPLQRGGLTAVKSNSASPVILVTRVLSLRKKSLSLLRQEIATMNLSSRPCPSIKRDAAIECLYPTDEKGVRQLVEEIRDIRTPLTSLLCWSSACDVRPRKEE